MAEVLGWSEEVIAREVEIYHARVAAERDSPSARRTTAPPTPPA